MRIRSTQSLRESSAKLTLDQRRRQYPNKLICQDWLVHEVDVLTAPSIPESQTDKSDESRKAAHNALDGSLNGTRRPQSHVPRKRNGWNLWLRPL
jgi:hypothetical protein